MTGPAPRINPFAVIRAALRLFWLDFAPIVIWGFVLLTLPALALRLLFGPAPTPGEASYASDGSLAQTFVAVLGMLYFAIVAHGGLSRLRGMPLPTTPYVRLGLGAARPGVIVSLLLGAAALLAGVVVLLGRGHPLGAISGGVAVAAIILIVALWLAVLPTAIDRALPPFIAIRAGLDLAKPHMGRLVAIVVLALLALLPPAMLVNAVMFGPAPTRESALAVLAEMTLFHPGLWIGALFELLAYGALACLPPATYAALRNAQAR